MLMLLCNVFTLQEGKNRQIRKMVGFFSHSVQHLTRVRFGNVTLDGLCEGEASELSDDEINSLLQICGKQG
jgi:16S rRNA U516 pseudouridylate synthase RsuA-like enzyme